MQSILCSTFCCTRFASLLSNVDGGFLKVYVSGSHLGSKILTVVVIPTSLHIFVYSLLQGRLKLLLRAVLLVSGIPEETGLSLPSLVHQLGKSFS